jgi:hypothetical protein
MASPPSGGATPGSALQYCYMFESDKRPTKQLDALLRAISIHIVSRQTPHSPLVFARPVIATQGDAAMAATNMSMRPEG